MDEQIKATLERLADLSISGFGNYTIDQLIKHTLHIFGDDVITVQEVRKLAKERYCQGGMSVYECYDDDQIRITIADNHFTRESWFKLFEMHKDMDEEMMRIEQSHDR